MPANGLMGASITQIITATFNEAMDASTVNAATFTVTGPGATPVTGAVSYAGTTATFTPTAALAASTSYTATITTGAKDSTGVALAANFVWTFTTTAPATVVSTVPANGATAAVNTTVSAMFSEAMNATTINATTFTVTGPGATPVTGAVTYAGTTATFTPTAALATSTSYTATITTGAKDSTGVALAANFVWTFTTAAPATVVSTVPANGATAAVNTTVSAMFSEAMNATTINATTFTVTGPGATPVTGAVTYAGTTATFTPTAVLATSTSYTATITTGAKDPTGVALAANFAWTFTTAAPATVVSTVPANAATAAVNTAISAMFSEAMNATTINATTFTVTGPGATPVGGVVTYAGTTATFTPTAALATSTSYTATITTGAKDPTGVALAANFVWTFTTAPPPAVTATVPSGGATNVPLNQKIAATFNVPMTASTITATGTFTLVMAVGGAAVPGAVTYDGTSNTAIFAPTTALAASTPYKATITTAAQSVQGGALGTDYVWSFTTGLQANATAPVVTSTDPDSAAIGVPPNQRIAATFSTSMDPATISASGTFTVMQTIGGVAVPGSVAYDPASNTAIFTPGVALATDTQYSASISNAATDLDGNALIAGGVPNPWSFTTGPSTNTVAPTITASNPASAVLNVPVNMTINATFSTAMDPTTITNATFTLAVAGVGGAPVDGTVVYDPASRIATFTPAANLIAGTQYTASISNLITDLSGNALVAGAAPNPWSFTAGTTVHPTRPNLGAASTFGAFGGGAGITNMGTETVINGDIGTTGVSTSMTGFHDAGAGCTYIETANNAGFVNGTIDTAPPHPTGACPSEGTASTLAIATQAASDALAAYNDLAGLPGGPDPGTGQLGGLTLTPGTYTAAASAFMITDANLTLDAQGDPNAIWVFQMASSLTVGTPTAPQSVILINGAQAKNVFWQVGSAATINGAGGGVMVGTIIASAGITFSTAGNSAITTLNGRPLGLNASVTMVNTVVNVPAP